jgi:tRNA pseudouridine55 synthase
VGVSGIVLLDKRKGATSFETVRKLKNKIGVKKAGHTGTLDKFASGLLVVCINRATAIQDLLMAKYKRYVATLRLGLETDTLDEYGRLTLQESVPSISEAKIHEVLNNFLGTSRQIPPAFSAIHINGKRSYKRALNGESIHLSSREIEIKEISLVEAGAGSISFEALVSKGTYIRSLGRDIARALGTCGHLTDLRRIEIGKFSVKDAHSIDRIGESVPIISMIDTLSELPAITTDREGMRKIFNGVPPERILREDDLKIIPTGFILVVFEGHLIALVEKGEKLRYFRVFKHNNVA